MYAAGFPDWKEKDGRVAVGTEYVKAMIGGGEPYLLVDSRPVNKYAEGYIPTAVNIPDTFFDKYKGMLPADKSTELVFYCGGYHCKLSHKSADKAREMGYTNVKVDEAGYPGWKEKYGAGMADIQITEGGIEGAIDLEVFKKILAENPESIQIIDVRDPDEFAEGRMATAVNIPVDQLAKDMSVLKGDKPIVYVCSTGARSGEAYYMTLDARPDIKDVYYLEAIVHYGPDGQCEIEPPK